jgi:hypothetical protein
MTLVVAAADNPMKPAASTVSTACRTIVLFPMVHKLLIAKSSLSISARPLGRMGTPQATGIEIVAESRPLGAQTKLPQGVVNIS